MEGSVDPVRDLEIITNELIMKDLEKCTARLDVVTKIFSKGQDKTKKQVGASRAHACDQRSG